MKLRVLEDNNTFIDEYYLGEPAVSYYIENENEKILFDTRYSDAFIQNAKKMSIDLNQVQKIVLSHGHNDHTGGLPYLLEEVKNKNITLIAHENCFEQKILEQEEIGSPITREVLAQACQLKLTKQPVKVSKNITFLGEIPDIHLFEKREQIGVRTEQGKTIADTMKDDSAMVHQSEKGLFIITGCSHSGICNIIDYAKKICQDNRVLGVIGGFHLFEKNEKLKGTIQYLKENQVSLLYPCHCISLDAKIEMAKTLTIHEVGVGMELVID